VPTDTRARRATSLIRALPLMNAPFRAGSWQLS
jgi:hypothetical protein